MPLSASKRISLLKEISDRFQMEEWPLIDLTLSQFGMPTSDEWQGNKNAYVIQMSKAGQDPVLVELAQHVGFLIGKAQDEAQGPSHRHVRVSPGERHGCGHAARSGGNRVRTCKSGNNGHHVDRHRRQRIRDQTLWASRLPCVRHRAHGHTRTEWIQGEGSHVAAAAGCGRCSWRTARSCGCSTMTCPAFTRTTCAGVPARWSAGNVRRFRSACKRALGRRRNRPISSHSQNAVVGSGRQGTLLRECPPAFGLRLYFAAQCGVAK